MDKIFVITQSGSGFGDSWTKNLGFVLDEQTAKNTIDILEEQRKIANELQEERERFRKKLELEIPQPDSEPFHELLIDPSLLLKKRVLSDLNKQIAERNGRKLFERNMKICKLVEQWFTDRAKQYDKIIVDLVQRRETDCYFDYEEIEKI